MTTTFAQATEMEKLIGFIQDHKCGASVVEGQLYVSCEAVTKDGSVIVIRECIPATWQAVRRWLGY